MPRVTAGQTPEALGPWDLPLAGFEVLQMTFAYPIDLVAYGPDGVTAILRFHGSLALIERGGATLELGASKDSWGVLSTLLSLRHDRLRSVRADDRGLLVVAFGSGRRIEARSTDRYENWQVTGPDFQLITLPDCGVAMFEGPHD